MKRQLYLVAYDVRDTSRLRLTHSVLKDFACGGQKSAFECFLTQAEREELIRRVKQCIDPIEDALLVIRLIDSDNVSTLGIAVKPADQLYTYLG